MNETTDSIWCVVPVYNNAATLKDIVVECRTYLKNVLVVDDGSSDTDVRTLLEGIDVTVLSHSENKGKGEAILTALEYISTQGGRHMITIDADGQHYPRDIEKFIPLIKEDQTSVIVGCRDFSSDSIPGSSKFGRAFSNFWLRLESGVNLPDTQSGFRSYPVDLISRIKFKGHHYDFEVEVLARAAWAGLSLKSVDIGVYYPSPEERISHFLPVLDNARISHAHACLVGRRLLPWPHKKLIAPEKIGKSLLRHPHAFFLSILKEHSTPGGLAVAAAVGILLAVLPLISLHTVAILYVTMRLNLNKVMALSVQHLCMPPFVPMLCIEIGYYMMNGEWLTEVSFDVIFGQIPTRLLEWLLGSLIVAPIAAVIAGVVVFFVATLVQKKR